MTVIYAIAAADAVLGCVIFFVCFCRAVVSDTTVLKRVRAKFVLLGPSALAFGFSPLWGDWPGYVNVAILVAVLYGLFAETFQWRDGPPNNVRIDSVRAELESEDGS